MQDKQYGHKNERQKLHKTDNTKYNTVNQWKLHNCKHYGKYI